MFYGGNIFLFFIPPPPPQKKKRKQKENKVDSLTVYKPVSDVMLVKLPHLRNTHVFLKYDIDLLNVLYMYV